VRKYNMTKSVYFYLVIYYYLNVHLYTITTKYHLALLHLQDNLWIDMCQKEWDTLDKYMGQIYIRKSKYV
jgi:hypothetical protein